MIDMADRLSKADRSRNMAAIKAKNTKPELRVRQFLHKHGLRYALHRKDLPGKPDLVFVSRKIVLFVHGCFWHGHEGCSTFRLPKTRRDWWRQKIYATKVRDERNTIKLKALGWRVLEIWECETQEDNLSELAKKIRFSDRDFK